MSQKRLILHLDSSKESEFLRKAVLRAGLRCNIVYNSSEPGYPLPAIESEFGMIHGWPMVKAYYQLPVE